MALVVETGSGLSTAESYISVADADTYFDNRDEPTGWTGADTDAKEDALRIATQYLDAMYHHRWLGVRSSITQRLSWPRNDVEIEGFVLTATTLPRQLVEATAEAAYRHLTDTDGLMPDVDPGIKAESVRVGPISESVEYSGTKPGVKRFKAVDMILTPLLTRAGSISRG
jgi:hypothetical protein